MSDTEELNEYYNYWYYNTQKSRKSRSCYFTTESVGSFAANRFSCNYTPDFMLHSTTDFMLHSTEDSVVIRSFAANRFSCNATPDFMLHSTTDFMLHYITQILL